MKSAYQFLILLLFPVFLSSCAKYYVNTVSSASTSFDGNGVFKHENDSVLVTYNFFGEGAPLHIIVKNRTNSPLYVDWSRSAMIIRDRAVSYLDNKVVITGTINGDSYNWDKFWTSHFGDLNASASLPNSVSFIPPHSDIEKVIVLGNISQFEAIPKYTYAEKEYFYPETGPVEVKAANFAKDQSPLAFKSYITLFTTSNNKEAIPFVFQDEFYISKSIKTYSNPNFIAEYKNKAPNIFYIKKPTFFGKTTYVVGAAAIVSGAALVSDENGASDTNSK
ncbi:hypothetical protein BDE36_0260 [Arcticibacter tournemirensis]|uniref:Uncharacterized protein n=1 Tax=Arcticibacter tournemirensis TaxID=699437 RepID=A0A5M9GV00_9SPHI|nr:hypothetical protein [Arcticibacter tournemirensis]KAA8478436.1 hypothetical protein F1649_17760 [Arcticibacter tournemirensis]TQM48573.1 hypothetical protein BDE36_0260 [Arcticibacter tournemirensis]